LRLKNPTLRGPRAAWRAAARGLLWGLGIGLAVGAVGQLTAFVLFLAQGANGSYGPYLRLGAVYVELFHRVSLEVRALPLGEGPPLSVGLGLGLLLIPSAAVAVLGLAGRRIARSSPAGTGATVLGLAAGYAVVPFLLSFVGDGDVTLPASISAAASLEIRVSTTSALAVPFAMALVAVVIGTLSVPADAGSGSSGDALAAEAVRGGVRAFALGLLLSIVGVLVLASVQPWFARAYAAVIGAPDSWRGRVVVGGHAALLLPNQAMWVLVPAMGGCDEAVVDARRTPFLCLWRVPTTLPVTVAADAGIVGVEPTYRPPPRGYLAFLLLPLVATVVGGIRAGHGASSTRNAVVLGAASGLVFAGLVAAAIAFARIDVRATGGFLGDSVVRFALGPELLRGTGLAAVWGVAGGTVGGALSRYVRGTGTSTE
jgi:hypothetical protein